MNKIVISIVLLILAQFASGQQMNPTFRYSFSFSTNVPNYHISFEDTTLSLIKFDYWYQINSEEYYSAKSIDIFGGRIYVNLDTLHLKPEINTLQLFYKENNNIHVFQQSINCVNPVLTINSVLQGNKLLELTKSLYVTHKNEEVILSYSVIFPKIKEIDEIDGKEYSSLYAPIGSRNLSGIKCRFNGGNIFFSRISNNIGDVKLNNFIPGLNQLLVTYETFASSNETIIYKTDTLNFYYLDFNLPSMTWKKDTLLKLTGTPAGGWFTGQGIVGNSNYFNPSLVSDSSLIIYNLPFRGNAVTYTKKILVKSYDYRITGPLSVCLNNSALYKVEPYNSEFNYKWTVDLGISSPGTNNETNTIRWNRTIPPGVSFGNVVLVATHKTTGAVFSKSAMVNLKKNAAYDPPELFFGDANKKLIICTKKDANHYNWFAGDSPQGTTTQPYFNFPVPAAKYAAELVTPEGCLTKVEIAVSSSSGYSGQVVPISRRDGWPDIEKEIDFRIFPNPASDEVNVLMPANSKPAFLRIYNDLSVKVFETTVKQGELLKNLHLSGLCPGNYIIQLNLPGKTISKQFIKVN